MDVTVLAMIVDEEGDLLGYKYDNYCQFVSVGSSFPKALMLPIA